MRRVIDPRVPRAGVGGARGSAGGRRALALLALSLLPACRAPEARRPAPLVEYAGCRAVFAPEGTCVLRSKRELRLWIATPPGSPPEVRVDGRRIDAAGTPVREGLRFTLTVPAGARRVEVRAPGPEASVAWSLPLADADPVPAPEPGADVVAAIDAATASVYQQLRARDLVAARATLGALSLPPRPPAESRYLLAFYRGMLAEREGDFRTALAETERAVEIAERVKPERYLWLAEEELALILRGIGRSREAAALFERLRSTPYAGNACEEAQLLNNLAWATLLAREAGESLADPTPVLEAALGKYEGCAAADAGQKANALLNLALAHVQAGRTLPAATFLARARALEPHPPVPHRLWWLDLEGRIALAEGRPRIALARYAALDELAAETGSSDGRLRAAFGEARAHRAVGEPRAALALLAGAEALLDAQTLQIPLDEGRETFLAARRSLGSLHVSLLLDTGRVAEALDVARRARGRILRQLSRNEAPVGLAAETLGERTRLLTEYQRRRTALEERVRDEWKLPADRLAPERAARRAEADAVRALLDQAYALGGAAAPAAEALPALRDGELLLVYHPLSDSAWVAFAATPGAIATRRFDLPAGALPSPAALAARMLDPFGDAIERAQRLRVLASGRLEEVDVHALPFAGEPLLAAHPVVYGLDLPPEAPAARGARALLVSDPRGNLPGARREADAVRSAFAAPALGWHVEELRGAAASADAVRGALPRADLLHYAGHADYSGPGGWDSALLLADGTRLTLGDLLALDRVPEWVVLSGCDTAKTAGAAAGAAPVAGLGLAHAFLLAGSQAVVAATRPADDASLPAFLGELYRRWPQDPDLAVAVQQAQLAWRTRHPADWALFRLLER